MQVIRWQAKIQTFTGNTTVANIIKWVQDRHKEGYFLDISQFDEGVEMDEDGITIHMKKKELIPQEVAS